MRTNAGGGYTKGGFTKFAPKGFFDATGWTSDGKFFGAEFKVKNNKLSPEQQTFQWLANGFGCRAVTVRCPDCFVDFLDSLNLPKIDVAELVKLGQSEISKKAERLAVGNHADLYIQDGFQRSKTSNSI